VETESYTKGRRWGLLAGALLMSGVAATLGFQTWRLAPGEFYTEEARIALRDHQSLSALSFSLRGLQFEQNNPELYYYLGRSRVGAGEMQTVEGARDSFYRAALTAYESARALAPKDETYWVELAFTLDSLARFEEGEWMFYEANRLDPRSEAIKEYYEVHLENWRNQDPAHQTADPAVTGSLQETVPPEKQQ
jgi:tetratricopeptide (TPR) repeat protein